jgi:hypothetical protein
MAESQSSLTTASGSVWTREQDKAFENALNVYDEDSPNRWEQIAAQVAGKDAAEVKRHYEILQEDINLIDSGRVALPNYSLSSLSLSEEGAASDSPGVKKGASFSRQVSGPGANANGNGNAALGGKGMSSKSADQERRKGIPWSEEEHRWDWLLLQPVNALYFCDMELVYVWSFFSSTVVEKTSSYIVFLYYSVLSCMHLHKLKSQTLFIGGAGCAMRMI